MAPLTSSFPVVAQIRLSAYDLPIATFEIVKKSFVSSLPLLFESVKPTLILSAPLPAHKFEVFASTGGVLQIGTNVVVVLNNWILKEARGQDGLHPPDIPLGAIVYTPGVAVGTAFPNATMGEFEPPPPISPVTMTYRTAASTTVIATRRIVAITGETASTESKTREGRFTCATAGGCLPGPHGISGIKKVSMPKSACPRPARRGPSRFRGRLS